MLLIGNVIIGAQHRVSWGAVSFFLAIVVIGCGSSDDPSVPTTEPRSTATELATSEPAMLYAADPGDQAGALTAGDFNGDGLIDLAMAAALADGAGNTDPDAGEVYVFLGPIGASDVLDAGSGDQAVTVTGTSDGDQTGRALASGDFNGDRIDDLAIGSPFADGPSSDRKDAGRVDIVAGSADIGSASSVSISEVADATVHGGSGGDFAGISLAAGNLNGDEVDDLVVGAFWAGGPEDSRPMSGEVYAVYGMPGFPQSRDLASSPADVTVYGAAAEDRLGEGVATGDINGDAIDDLVLPAPFATSPGGAADAGRNYVVQSPAPAVVDLASFQPLATVYGVDDGDQLGHVPATGDFDGDGRDDLLLTAVSADGPANSVDLTGEAAVFFSATLQAESGGTPGEATSIIYGEQPEDRLGRSAATGDIDGDGRAELLLGAPGARSRNGAATAGRLYVIKPDSLESELGMPQGAMTYFGSDAGDALSSSVYGRMPIQVADMDGDGRGEALVLAPHGDGPGNERADCGEAAILFITDGALR